MKRRTSLSAILVLVLVASFTGSVVLGRYAQAGPAITLKLAHQWPQDMEDYVVVTGVKFAEEVEKLTGGEVKIQFFPAESLVKARDTHKALKDGVVDMAIYPYVYAAGAIPELNITLIYGGALSHDNYFAWGHGEVMKYLEEKLNKELNIRTLAWIQICGGFASNKKMIRFPQDSNGLNVRLAGKYNELILKAMGAGVVTLTSGELYNGMQRGVLDAIQTSSSSFAAYKLYEVSKYYLSPEDYGLYFTCEPICISLRTWGRLTKEQQNIMIEVGKKVEQYALEGAKKEDKRTQEKFAKAGAQTEKMTKEQAQSWLKAAEQHAYPKFRTEIPNGTWILEKTLELSKKY